MSWKNSGERHSLMAAAWMPVAVGRASSCCCSIPVFAPALLPELFRSVCAAKHCPNKKVKLFPLVQTFHFHTLIFYQCVLILNWLRIYQALHTTSPWMCDLEHWIRKCIYSERREDHWVVWFSFFFLFVSGIVCRYNWAKFLLLAPLWEAEHYPLNWKPVCCKDTKQL